MLSYNWWNIKWNTKWCRRFLFPKHHPIGGNLAVSRKYMFTLHISFSGLFSSRPSGHNSWPFFYFFFSSQWLIMTIKPVIISKDIFGQGIGWLVIIVNAGQFHEAPRTLTSQRGRFEFSSSKIGTHI